MVSPAGLLNLMAPSLVLDLPGCIATGRTVEDAENEIRSAIEFHLEGMKEEGLSIPKPSSVVEYVEALTVGT